MEAGSARNAANAEARAVICQAFGCDEELGATIAAQARLAALPRGQQLWPLPDRDETTLLTAGRVQEVAYGRDGAVLVLHQVAPGEFYGSLMGSGGSEGTAQVEAVTDSTGAHFATSGMVRLMESYHGVAMAISRQLVARVEAMRRRMVENALLSATGRICAELLRQAAASEDGVIRPMPVLAELAVLVRSTRETVSRTISQLERRGLVARTEDGLRVVARHRLEEMVY